jgi:nitroreductase
MNLDDDPADADPATLVLELVRSRFSVPPKRLLEPGPDTDELRSLVEAAATAPDHHALRPWRLIHITPDGRELLADVFEAARQERSPPPDETDIDKARAKAFRAPVLLLAVLSTLPPDPDVPLHERHVTLGAALMAMLLAAHGMGYAGMLTAGASMGSRALREAFGLADHEQAVCFLNLGTAARGQNNPRPDAADLLSDWPAPPA